MRIRLVSAFVAALLCQVATADAQSGLSCENETEIPQGSTVGQAVYWVGINLSSTGLTASSLRLATDTHEYFQCAQAATPPGDTFAQATRRAGRASGRCE